MQEHARTGMGTSGSATLFGYKQQMAHKRVETASEDGKAQTTFGDGHQVGARTVDLV